MTTLALNELTYFVTQKILHFEMDLYKIYKVKRTQYRDNVMLA